MLEKIVEFLSFVPTNKTMNAATINKHHNFVIFDVAQKILSCGVEMLDKAWRETTTSSGASMWGSISCSDWGTS